MANVKLRVNMILEGNFVKFGSIIDENKVPPHLKKRRYILREGQIDIDEENLKAQMLAVEQNDEEREKDLIGTEANITDETLSSDDDRDSRIRTRIANKKGRRVNPEG